MKIENGCRRKDTFWTAMMSNKRNNILTEKWFKLSRTSTGITGMRPQGPQRFTESQTMEESRGGGRCFNTFTSLLGLLALGPFLRFFLPSNWESYGAFTEPRKCSPSRGTSPKAPPRRARSGIRSGIRSGTALSAQPLAQQREPRAGRRHQHQALAPHASGDLSSGQKDNNTLAAKPV